MQKKYEYRIIKTYNKAKQALLYQGRNYNKAKQAYIKLIQKSKKVTIPKKHANKNKLIEIESEILLITTDPQHKRMKHPNKKIVDNSNEWIILDAQQYKEEEKFFSYPEQKYIKYEDIKNILNKKPNFYGVYLYLNKLIIDSGLKIELVVVCKNINEASLLYNTLHKEAGKFVFLGRLNYFRRKQLIKKIMKDTGISKIRLSSNKSKF